MYFPMLHSILRTLSARMRCRSCRRRAALLLALVAVAIVVAVTGCSEQGLTGADALPEGATSDDAATSLAPAPSAAPDAASEVVAEPGTASATRLPRSFFVDPRLGKDTNPGTKALPFKTVAKALSLALAQDSVRLAPGVYSKAINGEKFTNLTQQIPVRAGVFILGTFQEEFTSQLHGGPDETGLLLQGGATVRNVILSGFGIGIRASQGVQSLKGVGLDQNAVGMQLSGTARATLTNGFLTVIAPAQQFARGLLVTQQAQLIMDGGFISGGSSNCALNVIGVDARNSGRVTLRNSAKIQNIAGEALFMTDQATATLKGQTTIVRDFSAQEGCEADPSVVSLSSGSLTLQNAKILGDDHGDLNIGIQSHSNGPITLTNAVFTRQTGAALQVLNNTKVVINGCTFTGNDQGIDARTLSTLSMSITGSTFTDNTTAVFAPFFRLRSSKVTGNQFGIVVHGTADLGNLSQPGNNTLSGNVHTAVEFSESTLASGVGTIVAAGNLWNAGVQDADGTGHYPLHPVVRGTDKNAVGTNFVLPQGKSSFSIQL
jgi:Protein of unknown function (DUF1565)/Right handed beta helix region